MDVVERLWRGDRVERKAEMVADLFTANEEDGVRIFWLYLSAARHFNTYLKDIMQQNALII